MASLVELRVCFGSSFVKRTLAHLFVPSIVARTHSAAALGQSFKRVTYFLGNFFQFFRGFFFPFLGLDEQ